MIISHCYPAPATPCTQSQRESIRISNEAFWNQGGGSIESLPRRSPYRGELRLTADHPSISKFRRSLLKAGSHLFRSPALCDSVDVARVRKDTSFGRKASVTDS
jgi:hypothetical protein